MAQIGRNLWIHLAQHWLKQGHLEQGAQIYACTAFNDLQGGNSTTSLDNLC